MRNPEQTRQAWEACAVVRRGGRGVMVVLGPIRQVQQAGFRDVRVERFESPLEVA